MKVDKEVKDAIVTLNSMCSERYRYSKDDCGNIECDCPFYRVADEGYSYCHLMGNYGYFPRDWDVDLVKENIMSENRMADVAKSLGVKLGEEFNIKGKNFNPYRITDKGLVCCKGHPNSDLFVKLIAGDAEITTEPWFPEDGDSYWYLSYEGNAIPARFKNDFTSVHQMRVRLGNFFRTEQEAESYKEKWLAYYNQGADMSWREC